MSSHTQSAEKPSEIARKPYAAPQLKRLGSVRELTLGTTAGALEFGMRGAPM